MNLYNLKKKKLLGKGKFSSIYLASCSKYDDFILKEYKRTISYDDKTIVKNELIIWNMLQNTYIVKFYGIYNTKTSLSFMFEYCSAGDLDSRLTFLKIEGHKFTEMDIIKWSFHILNGLSYIHDLGIMHRDVEPSNILLKSHFSETIAKLCDFSYGYKFRSIHDGTKKLIGNPIYMAPEIFKSEYYHISVDIWSLGVTLVELCNFQHPFQHGSIEDISFAVTSSELPTINSFYSDDLSMFILSMLNRNQLLRPNAKTLLRDPLFMNEKQINEPKIVPQIFYDVKTYYETNQNAPVKINKDETKEYKLNVPSTNNSTNNSNNSSNNSSTNNSSNNRHNNTNDYYKKNDSGNHIDSSHANYSSKYTTKKNITPISIPNKELRNISSSNKIKHPSVTPKKNLLQNKNSQGHNNIPANRQYYNKHISTSLNTESILQYKEKYQLKTKNIRNTPIKIIRKKVSLNHSISSLSSLMERQSQNSRTSFNSTLIKPTKPKIVAKGRRLSFISLTNSTNGKSTKKNNKSKLKKNVSITGNHRSHLLSNRISQNHKIISIHHSKERRK